jgi:hypothetical protein
MNMQTLRKRGTLGAVLSLLLGGLALMPTPTLAQAPIAKLQGYEVAEHVEFLGGAMTPTDFRRRFADTAIIGDDVVGSVDPFFPNPGKKFADARASSLVNAKTGKGPIVGTFYILEDFDPTTNLLSTLQVVAKGRIKGTLDLSTILTTATAPVSGKWRIEEKDLRGTFQGTFVVPIPHPASPTGYVYINVDPTTTTPCRTAAGPETGAAVSVPLMPVPVCFVDPKEFLLGFPLTKLVLFLFADSADSD